MPKKLCGAQLRKKPGRFCRVPAMPNGRCRIHGGKTPAGPNSPNWRHGRFSKALPTGLLKKFEAAANDPTIGDLWRDLALLDTRIVELLAKLKPRAAIGDTTWGAIVDLSEQRRKIILTIEKARVTATTAVSLAQFSAWILAWSALIAAEFRRLYSQTIEGQDVRLQAAIRETLERIRAGMVRSFNLPEAPAYPEGIGEEDHGGQQG